MRGNAGATATAGWVSKQQVVGAAKQQARAYNAYSRVAYQSPYASVTLSRGIDPMKVLYGVIGRCLLHHCSAITMWRSVFCRQTSYVIRKMGFMCVLCGLMGRYSLAFIGWSSQRTRSYHQSPDASVALSRKMASVCVLYCIKVGASIFLSIYPTVPRNSLAQLREYVALYKSATRSRAMDAICGTGAHSRHLDGHASATQTYERLDLVRGVVWMTCVL